MDHLTYARHSDKTKGCSELPEQPFVFLRESFGSRSRQQERDAHSGSGVSSIIIR